MSLRTSVSVGVGSASLGGAPITEVRQFLSTISESYMKLTVNMDLDMDFEVPTSKNTKRSQDN
jgi:hypothetical protein